MTMTSHPNSTRPAFLMLVTSGLAAIGTAGCARDRLADAGPYAGSHTSASAPAPINPFTDPFAASTSGEIAHNSPETTTGSPSEFITLNTPPAPGQPSNAAINLYGEVMAKSMAGGRGGQTPRGGGSNLSQVSFSMEGADFDPNVSRDGTQIVFASTQHRETADLFIKNVDSRVVTQITNDSANDVMPKLSPDGGRIAFCSNRSGNWDIYVMPTTGGKAVQITSSAADDLHPTWSPGGNQLAFSRLGEVSGQWELWVTDVGNTGVARFIGYGLFPEWCPVAGTGAAGADRIAYQKSRERGDRAFGIWTVDYSGGQAGNTTEIASSPTAACINPAWSHDGKWIAYATVPNPRAWAKSTDSRPASADLWIVDINGNSRISLTAGSAVNLMPSWGPHEQLFFVSDRGGVDNIWAMDTGKVIALANANMTAGFSGTAVASNTHGTSATSPATTESAEHSAHAGPPESPVATVPGNEAGAPDPH
jgi:TolB protein